MTTIRPLSAGDLAALELLRADRDGEAEGVAPADLQLAAGTRFLEGVLRRLRKHRYVIGINGDGSWELGHGGAESGEASSTGAGDADPALSAGPSQPRSPGASDGGRSAAAPSPAVDTSSDAPVEGRLFEMPSTSHFDVRAEAA